MQQAPLPNNLNDGMAASARYIYIACPWSAAGGGMYKVGDYLIRSQGSHAPEHGLPLRPLDTRGPGSALVSLWVLLCALGRLLLGRLDGRLAGVHVNMAERLSLFRKGTVVVACRALGLPVVIHLHAQMRPFYRSLPGPLRALVRWMYSLADGVIVIGPKARAFVHEELGVPLERIDVVINGVPGPATAPQPAAPGRKPVRIAFVGRLCEPKGIADLLHALAGARIDHAGCKLVLAGNGDIEGYRALARRLGVESMVEFAGWCEQPQVDALLQSSDLLVLPSHDEVMPLVVLEALAHGLPVICTPVGELPSLLEHGQTAWLVPPRQPDELARALERLVPDPALRRQLGLCGRALYEQQFSMQRFFANIARVHSRRFALAAARPGAAAAEVTR
jgi:glycosyltransferase involved in cell wall biosynthesis